jgi:hypothetical protein
MIIAKTNEPTLVTIEEVERDPVEVARSRAQWERYDRNWAWFQAHSAEIYQTHRGKVVVVAGQTLFVGDDVLEVVGRANQAFQEDDGLFSVYIPQKKLVRIYVNQR